MISLSKIGVKGFPYLSNFQGNGLSFGSAVAPWAAGWSDLGGSGWSDPRLGYNDLPNGMLGVGALYGGALNGGSSMGVGAFSNLSGNADLPSITGGNVPYKDPIDTMPGLGTQTLPGIDVNAYAPSSNPLSGIGALAGSGTNYSGASVTNMAPVTVTQNMPSPGFWGTYNNFRQNHPFITQAVETGLGMAVPMLAPVFTVANIYAKHASGQPWLSSLLPSVPNLLSGLDTSSPASQSDANAAMVSLLRGNNPPSSGGGIQGGGVPGNNIATSGAIPDYSGLGALSGNAPLGGYWNQQAIKMAHPTYGPYAGFASGQTPASAYPTTFAPTGIQTAGY